MSIQFRKAICIEIPDIVRLLAGDSLGAVREQYIEPLPMKYYTAFDVINADKNNNLIVAELNNKSVGRLQLTFITYLTYQGGKHALIEGAHTDKSVRGKSIGKAMLEWVIQMAKEEGCHIVQLTTDKKRPDALEFYKKLEFIAFHEGLKLLFN